jgi:hypothetical protein
VNPDDPQDLESALAAYRRLPRTEPSAALDAAIRARARAAVATRSRPRWPVLFATAATLVLAAGLGWRTWREGAEQPAPLAPPEAAVEAAAPAEVVAESAAAAKPAATPADNASADAVPLQDALTRAKEAAAAPPAQPVTEAIELRGQRESERPEPSPSPAPQAFSGTATDAARDVPAAPAPPPPASPAAAAPAPQPAANAAPISIHGQSSLGQLKKAEAAATEADARQSVTDAEAATRADASVAGVEAAPAAPATAGASPERARRQVDSGETAAAALEPIRTLLRQGRQAEAREALERWRADWPDATVPEDLRTLLQ